MTYITQYTVNDSQFYPTPKSFLEKIYYDFQTELQYFNYNNIMKWDIKCLEPSAGKGDIIKFFKDRNGHSSFFPRCHFDCIEIDKNLQAILKDNHNSVVASDFLTFRTYTKYDFIVMNPPFADGCKHLLKAIEIQEKFGGAVLCIINAETIDNICNNERKELKRKLEKYNAVIRYYNNAFATTDSERKTNVRTAVVWIEVLPPSEIYNSKVFEELDKSKKIEIDEQEYEIKNEIIRYGLDWITAIVKQYNEQIESTLSFYREYVAFKAEYDLRFVDITKEEYKSPISLTFFGEHGDINEYIEKVRTLYWKRLFANPKFSGKLTSKLVNELYSRISEMRRYDFSERNILTLLEENTKATIRGIEAEIISLFDTFTQYAQYDGCQNIHLYNGWKTNSAHKINPKIIIPFYGIWKQESTYSGTSLYNIRKTGYYYKLDLYNAIHKLTDMSKTFNYLANGVCGLEDMNVLEGIIKMNFDKGNAKNIETNYFILTFYKKGTCHIKFKNLDLLEKFNLFAGQQKGWLPPTYGKKRYSQMDDEEKTLVNEFSGSVEKYEEIYNNQNKYFLETNNLLRLG